MANFNSDGTIPTQRALSSRSRGTPWSGVRMISLITLFAFSSCLSSSTPSSRLQGARHNATTIISLFIQPPSRSDSFSPEWCRRQERSTTPNWTPNTRDESIPSEILASCAGPVKTESTLPWPGEKHGIARSRVATAAARLFSYVFDA